MAKTIKFNLICDNTPVRTIEDLQNNFSIEDVLNYYRNGLLCRWLKVRGYEEELKKVEKEKIVVGDGARLCYNTLTEQGITLKMAPEHLRMQSAWGVARAALELVRSGGLVSGEELAPVYCRLSQAERERLEREAKSK